MDFHSLDALYERFCEFFEQPPSTNAIREFARSVLDGKIHRIPGPDRFRGLNVWTLSGWQTMERLEDAETLLATHLGTTYEVVHEARKALGIQPLGENGE